MRQNVSKRLKATQMCVDDDEDAISKKPPLLIAQNTQRELGVAFSYLERNKSLAKFRCERTIYFQFGRCYGESSWKRNHLTAVKCIRTRDTIFLKPHNILCRTVLKNICREKNILERLRFTFTLNGRRGFVPRDQVFPLFSVYSLLLLHRNK